MTYNMFSNWEEKELKDIIICNPEEHIEKGSIVKTSQSGQIGAMS